NVKTDLTSGVANLTKQLIEIEKQKLINKGKDQILELLGGANNPSTNTNTPKDSTNNTKPTSNPIKNVLDDIIKGNSSKPKDSTNNTKPKSVKDLFNESINKSKKTDSIK